MMRAIKPQPSNDNDDLPRGHGQGVLVIPGFLTSDMTTTRLRSFLSSLDYRAEGWGGGANLGPSPRAIERLKERVDEIAGRLGAPIAVAGVSLGGVFAREIARMMPDHIKAVATLCSPVQLPVPTPLAPFVWALQRGFDKDLTMSATGDAVMPLQPMLVVYSRGDGVVQWQACVPPKADNITAICLNNAAHTTIGSNPQAQQLLANFLARAMS